MVSITKTSEYCIEPFVTEMLNGTASLHWIGLAMRCKYELHFTHISLHCNNTNPVLKSTEFPILYSITYRQRSPPAYSPGHELSTDKCELPIFTTCVLSITLRAHARNLRSLYVCTFKDIRPWPFRSLHSAWLITPHERSSCFRLLTPPLTNAL